jgi:TatD DNase family protein
MIFETHAHYDDKAFDEDRENLLPELYQNGITTIINVSSDLDSIKRTLSLAEKYPYIYGAVGVHPSDSGELTEETFLELTKACQHEKVVAVGEIGLDYYWQEPEKEIQKKWFERQLLLAQEVSLPVIIHSREAAKDTLDMMRALHAEKSGGVIHCFSYSKEMAAEFLKLDYYFGIGGVVTFQNAKKLREAVAYIPIDKILLETDSPYLAPVPNRGKRNNSGNIPYIAQEIAQIKGVSYEEIIAATRQNSERLFGVS